MILFQPIAKPIWRQPWLRLLLLSSGLAGLTALLMPQLPTTWLEISRDWATAAQGLGATSGENADRVANTSSAPFQSLQGNGVVRPYLNLAQLSHDLTRQALEKQQPAQRYGEAIAIAQKAMALRKQGKTVAIRQQEIALWQDALRNLKSISTDAPEYKKAQAKAKEYGTIVNVLDRWVGQQQSKFLAPIAAAGGNPGAVRISLCQLGTSECRSFQGDVPPVSLASLVKLPLAIALMHQVNQGKANLDDTIYIDPANFTENARGARIFVDKTYTLREVMVRMITESNNIATNQLIDYMGYDTINQALKAEGFTNTQVGYKLVGNKTYPKVMGISKNHSTADELTQMMMRIYSFTKDSDEEILNALVGQYDLAFGYRALNKEKPDIFWIGEKTGQNSHVIGSTVAFKVGEERYVMTVTIDKTRNQARLRQIIRDVARHVLEQGPLDQPQPGDPKVAQRL